jgi:hypothetical protein
MPEIGRAEHDGGDNQDKSYDAACGHGGGFYTRRFPMSSGIGVQGIDLYEINSRMI